MLKTNHTEAFEFACYKREYSNLARCYLELLMVLDSINTLIDGPVIDDLLPNLEKWRDELNA